MQSIVIISVYERKTNRHKWQLLIERSIAKKDFAIQWARNYYARLDGRWKPRQYGYLLRTVPRIGERTWMSLPCNDSRIVRIDIEEGKDHANH